MDEAEISALVKTLLEYIRAPSVRGYVGNIPRLRRRMGSQRVGDPSRPERDRERKLA